ncbi:hypothetical protein O181_119001 [Austropuccinia psidii MF-1]|uniref:Uncharacterized protein n=1 Tax=Austropuccinia psidii MF-1 TaxID=1389203 RepID=A0A9Q3KEX2_9BASI|nr:hypothetical protein [Austropuccinia psidii MF-1]
MTDTLTPTNPTFVPTLLRCGRSRAALNNPFIAQTKNADGKEAIVDKEYNPHQLCTIISQAINAITPEMKLKVDSSNFSNLEDNIEMLFDDFLDNPEYLLTSIGQMTYDEKLCQSILNHSVSDTICKSIICICPCSAIDNHLKAQYHIFTCASQVISCTNLL